MRCIACLVLVACGTPRPDARPPISNRSPSAPATKPPPAPRPANKDTGEIEVTSLRPDKGDANGGTYVVVKGSHFLKNGPLKLKVYFGKRQGSVVRFQSDVELIVQAPSGMDGEIVDVTLIFDPGGQRTLRQAFTFVTAPGSP